MRLFYHNLIDAAGVFAGASTQDIAFPASNVINEQRSLPWRTGITQATENVWFDLFSAQTATAVIILDHDLQPTDTSLLVEAASNQDFSPVGFSQAITYSAGPMLATFSAETFRWWRFKFTKDNAAETRDVGRIFIGQFHTTETQPDYDGYTRRKVDLSQGQRSVGGNLYFDKRSLFREIHCDFSAITQTQADAFVALFDYAGKHTSFFAQVDPAASGELAELLYVKLKEEPELQVSGFDSSLRYDTSLTFEEQL